MSGKVVFCGYVVAPNSTVTLSAGTIKGGVISDRLNVTNNAELKQPTQP